MDFRKLIFSLILFTISWKFRPLVVINWGTAQEEKIIYTQEEEERFTCSFRRVVMPALFPGCETTEKHKRKTCSERKMITYISRNLKYPKGACVEGIVVLNFRIMKDGSIEKIKILKDIGGGTGEEAIRVLKLFPKWIPASKNGKAIEMDYNLPFRFLKN